MTIDAFRAAIDALEPLVQSWNSLMPDEKAANLFVGKKNKRLLVYSNTPPLSAHATLALNTLLPRLQTAAVSLDNAYSTFSWAQHRSNRLVWTIHSTGEHSLCIGDVIHKQLRKPAHLLPNQHAGLRAIEACVLAIHHRLNGITVEPNDPTWRVASRSVGAPDAGTAQILKTVFADNEAALPPLRLEKVTIVTNKLMMRDQMAAALHKVHA